MLINLVHDLDLMRHLCGEIVAVQAATSNAVRGHAVEDTASVVLTFTDGALGSFLVSDAAVAPWGWDPGDRGRSDVPVPARHVLLLDRGARRVRLLPAVGALLPRRRGVRRLDALRCRCATEPKGAGDCAHEPTAPLRPCAARRVRAASSRSPTPPARSPWSRRPGRARGLRPHRTPYP